MKSNFLTKLLSMLIVVIMLVCVFPIGAMAAWVYDEDATTDDYYKLISQRYWQLAPGIEETEVVLNNAQGTRRQVVHSVSVDLNNPYNKVIPGYKGMNEGIQSKIFGTEVTSQQALNAEKLGYGNVVAATNAMLSWYDSAYYKQHPEYIGQPLGWNICNGFYYENSQGPLGDSSSSYAVLVINYDYHPITGEKRPDDMPKVLMRGVADPLTGWEENAISAWAWLVKPDANGNPVKQYGPDHGSGVASRTFLGIKADGTVVVSVSDGDQAPYSTGFTMGEMADYMVKMGCIAACNCDGGGSTTLCTQRPGEDLKVNCSLSDGGERPTTNTILIISNAPADGELATATISSDYDYYTPGSSVEFSVVGTDASGAKVDIPTDVQWAIAENGMGTINNGVFTSNGTEGAVTVQMMYKDKVVGERKINIATPDAISLSQLVVTIPYGKTANIPIKATVNNGLHTIGLGANDITFITDNSALGTFNGMSFSAVEESNAPANITSNVTAILNMGTNPSLNFQLNLGKASEVIFDFEGGQADVDEWNIIDNRKGTVWDYTMSLSLADKSNGEVHDGDYSMRMQLNGLSSNLSHSAEYGWIRLGINDVIELENARSVGFWLYIPEDCIHLWVLGNYMADTDDDGTYDSYANPGLPPAFPNQVYDTIDESGWHYLEFDVSQYKKIALKDERQFPCDGTNKDFFLQFIFARAKQNPILEHGTTIGPFTFYFDNFTVDYSEAVDDRENPVIEKIYINDEPMAKREVVIATGNTLSFTANVADAVVRVDANKVEHPLSNTSGINASSAKVFIDGVEVPASYSNGVMSANNVKVSDGYHRVRFEITDNAGNTSVMIRVFKVESGSAPASVQLVPADETLDRLLFGSVYWMNLKTTDIEKIQSIDTVIDMNSVNHWQLDHMILADGFTAEYSVNEDSNTATISFTRAGENDQTGEAIIAQIPVRILDYDSDIHVAGKTAAQYWETHEFWGHDLKLDVDKGLVTFVDGKTETFSNEEFSVDTEMYTPRYYMDADYLTTHGSTHIHTATPIADQAPTCTQPGYTGRTFCEVCNSIVEWGETIPATGHSYEVVGDKLACHCGEEITGSGIKTVNGKNYYLLAGTLASGWRLDESVAMADIDTSKYPGVEINPSLVTNTAGWYYFDDMTYEGINGKREFTILGVKVEYDFVNGLVEGVWKSDGSGMKYYYGPANVKYIKRSQLSNFTWAAIDGSIYAFDSRSHRYEGYSVLVNTSGIAILCAFDDDGVLIGKYSPGENYTGVFKCNSQITYLKNGEPSNAGLVKDGDDYYYIASGYEAVVGNYDVTRPNGLLLPGFYRFGADGRMISPPIYDDGPNADGSFYKNGKKMPQYQLVEFEGYYYFISDYSKYVRNDRVYLSARFVEGTDLTVGYYNFDETGKMVLKNGPNSDGYFYLNGIKQNCYQLIEFNGDYYFINDGHKYAKNTRLYMSARFVEGTDLTVGYYDFDADGKLTVKSGPNSDGYFYLNGIRQNAYQLIEYNGDYYFINDGHKYAKNTRLYMSARFVEGTDLTVGYYDFDADGKMVIKNGPNSDGYFYLNGIRQNAYQLIEYNGDYYFINDGHKYAKNTRLYMSARFVEGTDLTVGYYDFDADGKMVIKNGPNSDGYFYLNGNKQNCYQLIEFNGDYYFINDGHKYAKNTRLYMSARFVEGTDLTVGYYDFDADGKMVIKNGPYSDGYFYQNGTRLSANTLVKYEGNYYFIGAGNKYVTGKWQFTGMPNSVFDGTDIRPWHHSFDNEGKMIGYYEGIPNGRDIGDVYNLITEDGKDIKSGLLIRGCELDNSNYYFPAEIIEVGINRLENEFQIKFDMDLRSKIVGGLDVFSEDVEHKYYDMVLYEEVFTDAGKQKIKEVFTDLANPDNYPIYMHCTHGIDRTGTISFILEAVLGVPYQMCIYEYTLSVGSYGQRIVDTYNVLNSTYSGTSLKDKAEAFLLDCGITSEQIASLREIFLED